LAIPETRPPASLLQTEVAVRRPGDFGSVTPIRHCLEKEQGLPGS
jgi:hypothetical protein